MVPVELPGGRLGQYVKEFLVVSVGSQIVTKALGRKYGQALFAGGVIHIGVDMLQNYVTPFGAAGGEGVGYYWPPNSELSLMYGGTAPAGLPELGPGNGVASGRLGSRFAA